MSNKFQYSINPLVAYLKKDTSEFTKEDIVKYVLENNIRIINFRYAGSDCRLKTLGFPVSNLEYLENILTYGERVDGSSLFPYISASSSDLYVIPRFSTAYVDPFAQIPTLGLLCSYFTKDGEPLDLAPQYTLKKAHDEFKRSTGLRFEAMGELEFYVTGPAPESFLAEDQRGYHESTPFAKFETFRCEAMKLIAEAGGEIKYAHSEVGNFCQDGILYEQNEIEFLPTDVEKAADQLMIAKWILRTLAYEYDLDLTFAPKITAGKAGSGLHFHTRIMKGDQSVMVEDGKLSSTARRAIAGYVKCASSLTAFGNTNPTSYFRLVPHQEAPTSVCWGDRNRSVLVRVPLGWSAKKDMTSQANPLEKPAPVPAVSKQTVELRSADGSADIYLILAGLVTAARLGLESPDSLDVAEKTYVNVNIHDKANEALLNSLEQLPTSCAESADCLAAKRAFYEDKGVFAPALVDGTIAKLRSYNDADIRAKIDNHEVSMIDIVRKFYHCG